MTVLENMAGQGNVIGSQFEDLRDIIALVEDKSRVGVCLDTCEFTLLRSTSIKEERSTCSYRPHVRCWIRYPDQGSLRVRFAIPLWPPTDACPLRTTMAKFEAIVGTQYLRGIHLNDSKFDLASKKDRHENLGVGKIGLRMFSYIVADARMRDIPLVLETPCDDDTGTDGVWAVEIAALNQLASDAKAGEGSLDGKHCIREIPERYKINALHIEDAAKINTAVDMKKVETSTVETSSAVDGSATTVTSTVVTTVAVETSTEFAEVDDERLGELLNRIRVASAKSNAKKAAPKKSAAKGVKRKKKGDDSDDNDDDEDGHEH